MADLSHLMSGDLLLSGSGDLLCASGADATQQRVLRRLLTNQGGAIFHLAYGAGLPSMVGQPANAARIGAVIRHQMQLERGVGASPAPTASVTAQNDGTVTATVRYADQASGTPQQVTLTP